MRQFDELRTVRNSHQPVGDRKPHQLPWNAAAFLVDLLGTLAHVVVAPGFYHAILGHDECEVGTALYVFHSRDGVQLGWD